MPVLTEASAVTNFALQYSSGGSFVASDADYYRLTQSSIDLFITEAAPWPTSQIAGDVASVAGPAFLSAERLQVLTQQGRLVVGYVNVAVAEDYRKYWNPAWTDKQPGTDADVSPLTGAAPAWLQGQSVIGTFGYGVKFWDPEWKAIVIRSAIDVINKGYAGIFLDDLGAYFAIGGASEVTRRDYAVRMLEFVAEIAAAVRAVNPHAFVVANTDPYLLGNARYFADGTINPRGVAAGEAYVAAVDAHMFENKLAADILATTPANGPLQEETVLILRSVEGSGYLDFEQSWNLANVGNSVLFTTNAAANYPGISDYPITTSADAIGGGVGVNVIDGLAGNDVLDGGDGNDRLTGGAGNDRLTGGRGDDRLEGGADIDTAVFASGYAEATITFGVPGGLAGWVMINTPDEGTDTLTGVERVSFGGQEYVLADLQHAGATVRQYLGTGAVAALGRSGFVIGTNGAQDLTLVDKSGSIVLDASFTVGNDILRLPGTAAAYTVQRSGSNAVFRDSDANIVVPIGTAGMPIAFADGVRTLVANSATGQLRIGAQVITSAELRIDAPSQGAAPIVQPTGASSRLYMAGGAVDVGGKITVTGTAAAEAIHVYTGWNISDARPNPLVLPTNGIFADIRLDASFNLGGDRLVLPGNAADYDVRRSGSVAILESAVARVEIPVGTAGMTVAFDNGVRILKFDTADQTVRLGYQKVDTVQRDVAVQELLDTGHFAFPARVSIFATTAILIDDADVETHVHVAGFSNDDRIVVLNAALADLSFARTNADGGASANDLAIRSATGETILTDVLAASGAVSDYLSARAAFVSNPGDFLTFA